MDHHTIDIMILGQVDAAELTGLINQPGLLGAWTADQATHVYWEPCQWTPQTQGMIVAALRTLGMADPEQWISIHSLPSRDWNAQWASHVKPIRIGRHIRIRPSWELPTNNPEDIELVIDPKQAFGTGHHATTQLLTEWLEDVIQGGETLLDIGTGSGILAMVALRLGASRALGFDCDPQAIACAQDYGDVNGFGPEVEFSVGTLEQYSHHRWDLVVANIDRRTLLHMAETLSQFIAASGTLLVSGLLVEDREEISNRFMMNGWSVAETREKEEWLALRFTRSNRSGLGPPAVVPKTQ